MFNLIHIFSLFLFLAFVECKPDNNSEKAIGYNMSDPDKSFVMPDTLREVSGLTYIDNRLFACIQDENGILFMYDAVENKIVKQYTFNLDGDYEGIARVGKTMFVLRSDGTLFEIVNFESQDFQLMTYDTGIPANNNEGLCYDPDNNRLLIASKGKLGKGPELKDKRVIYGFDLKTKKLTEEPVFEFDLRTIKHFASKNKVNLPVREKKKGKIKEPIIKFRTSAISIHPVTGKLFLLSAADHLLLVFNMNGQIEYMEPLNKELFNKAEGITFFENGDMLITNEGQDKKPSLLRFNYITRI